jgi:hypothetical protein
MIEKLRMYDREMRAWIEVPAGWGWGPVQVLKASAHRAGYAVEEHRVNGHVMLAVTGSRREPGASLAASPPDWRGGTGSPPRISR